MDVPNVMDVSVYPPPPQPLAVLNHSRLGQLSYPDPAFGSNKVRKKKNTHTQFCIKNECHCDVTLTGSAYCLLFSPALQLSGN